MFAIVHKADGWVVRSYDNPEFDTEPRITLIEVQRDLDEMERELEEELALQQQAEIAAENAWLVASELPTADDLAFEQWEAAQGLV